MARGRRRIAEEEEEVVTSKSMSSPFVSIRRNYALDEAALARLTLSTDKKVKVDEEADNCFLCGSGTLTSLTTLGRRLYLKQVEAVKTYLAGRRAREGVETCAKCVQDIKEVWDLHQEIEAIKEDIARIVEKVVTRDGGGNVNKVRRDGWGPKSRRLGFVKGVSTAPIGKGFATSQNSESIQFHQDPISTPELRENPELSFDIKEEVSWADAGSEPENCFEMCAINPQPETGDGEELAHSEENILNSDILTLSPNSRPKRKSRLIAEDILSKVRMSEEHEHFQDEGREPAISEPEGCSSDSEDGTDPESDSSEGPLKKKRKEKTPPQTETFPCSSCSKGLTSQRGWAVHEATICEVPGWTTERLKEFHAILYPCLEEGCGKLFSRPSEVMRHLSIHTGLKPFSCPTCRKSFTRQSTLDVHTCQRRPRTKMDKVLCDLCGVSVASGRLSLHNKRVHGQRKYPCLKCDKRFVTPSDRERHLSTVHEGKGESTNGQSLVCGECGEQFRYRASLSNHRARRHPDQSTVKHECDKCPRVCYTRIELQRHLHRHTKHGWWCGDCGKNFRSESKLETHKASLNGGRCVLEFRGRRINKPKDKEEQQVPLIREEDGRV